ncbi:MAG: c-type cytochrome [Xanthobacteraceae bacterium]
MKKVLATLLVLVVLGPLAAFLFVWSGLYSIAADRGHFAPARWFLEFAMRRSVAFHARDIKAPPLDDPALVERGAGHFFTGCAPCHGAPGFPPSPVSQQMLPVPPQLSEAIPSWTDAQLFWIVQHGLKYTGMPGWPATNRPDEIWAIVALLRQLPQMNAETFRRLAGIGKDASADLSSLGARDFAETDPAACNRCHGANGGGNKTGGVPRLAGQKPDYLAMTLQDYRFGTRQSGIMQSIAVYLSDQQIRRLAIHYGAVAATAIEETRSFVVATAEPDADPLVGAAGDKPKSELAQIGASIVAAGDSARRVPACSSCHGVQGRGRNKNPRYPALAGQHFDYIANQLRLWRAGNRGGTFTKLMSTAARNLTDRDIDAVATYLSGLEPMGAR